MVILKILLVLVVGGLAYLAFNPIKKGTVKDRMGNVVSNNAVVGVKPGKIGVILGAVILVMVLSSGFGTVPTGYKGVVERWNAATGKQLDSGIYWIMPVRDSVKMMNVQVTAYENDVSAASKDQQDIYTSLVVNYRVEAENAANLHIGYIGDWKKKVLDPRIEAVVKANTAMYKADEILQNRAIMAEQILKDLQVSAADAFIEITSVSITNIDFTVEYKASIEAKVIAGQRALEAENMLRQVEFEAAQTIEKARAEAEKIRIQAEAIQESGGREYVALQMVQRWNGEFPDTYVGGGDGGGPFQLLDISNMLGN